MQYRTEEERRMSIILQIVSIAVCLLMLYGLCVEMKKKHLSENQAILWIGGVAGLLLLSIFPKILPWAAELLGIWWPPASLIFFFLIVMILIILRHTITISAMETEIKELAMQVALLKDENRELEDRLNSKAEEENTNI